MSPEPIILIVDDEPHMVRLLHFALRELPARIESCGSGVQAVEFFAHQPVNVLILDFDMPELDGVETLRRIREMPGGAGVSVIMLTARDQTLIRHQASGLDIVEFMTKPFSPADLVRSARDLLEAGGA